jgi:beta-lactamase class A
VEALMEEKAREPGGIMGFFVGPIDSPLLTDPRDTTTPNAMAALLSKFVAGEVVDAPRTEVLMSIMEQTRTGAGRIKGMLPPGTVVGHKTGTGHNIINDAGYIRLPDGRILVVVVYTNSPAAISQKEQAIAQIARAAYDWALYSK